MTRHYFTSKSQRGVGLLYALIILFFVSLTVVGILKYLGQQAKAKQIENLQASRNMVLNNVSRALATPGALYASGRSSFNPELQRCVGTRAGNCRARRWTEFFGRVPIRPGPSQNGRGFAGNTGANRIYYNRSGGQCTTPGPNCPFQAVTEFWAECPAGGANCSVASTGRSVPASKIKVRVRLQQAGNFPVIPGSTGPGRYRLSTRTFPDETQRGYNPDTDDIVIYGQELSSKSTQYCPEGARQVGVLENGDINCECWPDFPQIRTAGLCRAPDRFIGGKCWVDKTLNLPACNLQSAEIMCPPRTTWKGYQADGRPYCEARNDGYICDRVVTIDDNGRMNCGSGYRLRRIDDPNECYVDMNGDRGRVYCRPRMRGTCCKPAR